MSNAYPFTLSGFASYVPGVGVLKANGGDLGGGSETLIVQPVLSKREPDDEPTD